VAEAFTKYLYTPLAQKIFATNGFRPVTPEAKAATKGKFPAVKTFTVADFGGWKTVNKKFFGSGGTWDEIFSKSR
jgi:sulfate transport system substrate-binding protein